MPTEWTKEKLLRIGKYKIKGETVKATRQINSDQPPASFNHNHRTAQRKLFNDIRDDFSKYLFHDNIDDVMSWVEMTELYEDDDDDESSSGISNSDEDDDGSSDEMEEKLAAFKADDENDKKPPAMNDPPEKAMDKKPPPIKYPPEKAMDVPSVLMLDPKLANLIAETIKAKELHIKAKELYEAKHNELLKEFHKH
jgi:hypothetical protein